MINNLLAVSTAFQSALCNMENHSAPTIEKDMNQSITPMDTAMYAFFFC